MTAASFLSLRTRRHKEEGAKDGLFYAFLPAAIEVERRPSSKAGRIIIWLIVLLFVVALVWASLGKIDIVAVAQGKVIPSETVKQIQPLETARIKSIYVKEGQRVQQGQLLIELDSKGVKAELESIKAKLSGVTHNALRLSLLAQFLESAEHDLAEFRVALISDDLPLQQKAQLLQEYAEVRSMFASYQSEGAQLSAEQSMARAEISKKQLVMPVLKERVDALDTLQKKSYGSKLQYLELKQALIEAQQDLAVQKTRLDQLKQAERGVITQWRLYLADKRKQTLAELNALQVQKNTLDHHVTQAEQRMQHYRLTAPISGRVQQLATTTIGGVVQSAQTLMQLVPSESALEVEAMILNKDIGFVQEGQQAAVKIDTFNFTKYGLIDAEIISLSDDALADEVTGLQSPDNHAGLVYSARLKLSRDSLVVDGRQVRLSPGMSVTTEIKTGQRRLIEFFLSPLLRYKQESLGER